MRIIFFWLIFLLLFFPFSRSYGQMEVTTMPSFNGGEGNDTVCHPVVIWGIAEGGYPPYSCRFFVDDVPHGGAFQNLTGRFIFDTVTFSSPGMKTIRLEVTDSHSNFSSHESSIKIWPPNPPDAVKVNMYIEKGLLYLDTTVDLWHNRSDTLYWRGGQNYINYDYGGTAAAILAFEEQGHFSYNSFSSDPYSHLVRRGLNYLLGPYSGQMVIHNNPDGVHPLLSCVPDSFTSVGGPGTDSSGYHRGSYLFHKTDSTEMYANSLGLLAVIMAWPDSARAYDSVIRGGYFHGWRYYNLIKDGLDLLYWSQGFNNLSPGSTRYRGAWCYEFVPVIDSGPCVNLPRYRYDGSCMQWPVLVMKFAKDRWGIKTPQWIKDNIDFGFQHLTEADNGVGYCSYFDNPNTSKTGGKLAAYALTGNVDVAPSKVYIASNYLMTGATNAGWSGNLYAMYSIKKGMQFQNDDYLGPYNWYHDMVAWLTGEKVGRLPSLLSGTHSTIFSYGAFPDGSWQDNGNINERPLGTAFALLILTKSLTSIPPVAVITQLSCHPICDSIQLDGSNSFHVDPLLSIVDWAWKIDLGTSVYYLHGKRPTIPPNLFPNTGWYKIRLSVKDNGVPPQINIATDSICISGPPHPPIAVPVPRPRISYNGQVNGSVTLDASGSYDPNGTAVTKYLWNLTGNSNCSGSGQNYDAITTSAFLPYSLNNKYNGVIGLRVISNGDTSSVQYAPIIFSNNDLGVDLITGSRHCQDNSVRLQVSVHNDVGSQKDFQNVLVNFWNDDPRTKGKIISKDTMVTLVRGVPVTFTSNVHYTPDLEKIYIYLDANEQIDEWNENNNLKAVNVPRITHEDRDTICQNSTNHICVTCNDEINALSVTLFNLLQPSHGTAGIFSNTTITYTPVTGFTGEDTLRYILRINYPGGPCYDTAFVYIHTNLSPVTNFSYSNILPCFMAPVTFLDSSTTEGCSNPIISWKWLFDDPGSGLMNTSFSKDQGHLFSHPDTFHVLHIATNKLHCSDSATKMIIIPATLPHADFHMDTPECMTRLLSLYDSSSSPAGEPLVKWEWNFGDGTSETITSPPGNTTHIFNVSGYVTVHLKVTNSDGCSDSIGKQIYLYPPPQAGLSSEGHCVTDTLKFFDESHPGIGSDITSYYWDFDNPGSFGNTTSQINPTHFFTSGGTYNVKHIVWNLNGCVDSIIIPTVVKPLPLVDYQWQLGNQNLQVNFHIDSVVTQLNVIGNMVLWNFGDGSYGYGHNPVHIYPACGTFEVILSVTDTLGCKNSISHFIIVPCPPIAFFATNLPQCIGQPVCFTDLSGVPPPPFGFIKTWIWNYGDGSLNDTIHFPNSPNVCHIYTSLDSFEVNLKVIDNVNYTDDYSAFVSMLQKPSADFTETVACQNMPVSFTDASFKNGGGEIISWDWDFGDPGSGTTNTSGDQNPQHYFTSGDTIFYVRLVIKNFNNCRDTVIKPVYVFPAPPVDFTFDTACLDQPVHFNSNTGITKIDSIVSWEWNFGDGTPVGTEPLTTSHIYTGTGTFNVTLTVTDHHECEHAVTHTVKINPLPVPNFSWASPACQGIPLQFYDNSSFPAGYSGYLAKWTWHFDDGSPDTTISLPGSPDIIHSFSGASGTHTVRLTVWTGDSCKAFIEQTVTSLPHPVANFEASPTTCQGQPVQFTDLSQTNGGGSLTSWFWTFSDPTSGFGNTSTLQDPLHTFSLGNAWYRVTLLVTNGNTCHDTISKLIFIRALQPVDYSYDTACLNQPVHYNANSGITMIDSIGSWDWNFGDGQPHSSDPVTTQHLYNSVGTFTTTLTVTDLHGCISTRSHTVHVNPLPLSNFSWNSPVCEGKLVCFLDQSTISQGYLARWQWHWGDGSNDTTILIPGSPDVCHRFLGNSTAYNVALTVWTNDSCTTFIEKTINIVHAPVANFQYTTVTCAGQTVHFTDISQTNGGGNITSWNWNFGDPPSGSSNFSLEQNPLHTFALTGSYLVTLIVLNANGCDSTAKDTVTIQASPLADFAADTACLGQPTHFTDFSNANAGINGMIVSYSWDFGDGSPPDISTNPTHTYATAGIFTVTLTIINSNGCIKSITKTVIVNPLPIAAFIYTTPVCVGAQVCYTDLSSTPPGYPGIIVKWHWNWDDGTDTTILLPGTPNVCHTFSGSATSHVVTLSVTTGDSCSMSVQHNVIIIPSPAADFTFSPTSCATQLTHFTDQSQQNGGGPVTSWLWNFGDAGSGAQNQSIMQNPDHPFSHAGSFWVTLLVSNVGTCADTIGKSIVVDSLPIAGFNADTVCIGNTTTFTNTSGGGIIQTYYWQFGDGQTGSQASPQHQYTTAGIFHVILTISTNHGCQSTFSRDILVIPAPVANFSFSSPTCAETDSVHFTDLSLATYGSIVQWDWSFGDASQNVTVHAPNDPSVYHIYSGGGTYLVTLTVHTGDSCMNTKTNTVSVQPVPMPDFSFQPVRCENSPVQFTDLSQQNGGAPISGWTWDFGDPNSGTSNNAGTQNPQHSFTTNGTFIVRLDVTNTNGCHDTISKPVSINAGPHARFSADTVCFGSMTSFTDSSFTNQGTITSWLWNFGDPASGTQNSSTLPNPIHNYTAAGNWLVSLHVTNSATCAGDTLKWVTVNPIPVAMFQAGAVCVHDSTRFTDFSIAPGSTVIGWHWDFGDGFTSTIQNPYHTYQSAQTYNVTETVTNLPGCIDSITIPVTARPTPTARFTYTNFFCPSGQVNFQDESTGSGAAIVSHFWTFEPGEHSTLVNPVHVFSVTDTTYAVMEIVTDNFGCQDTVVDSVYVKKGFLFKITNDTVCQGEVTHFHLDYYNPGDTIYEVTWDFGGDSISHGYNATHIYTHPGVFIVKVKAVNSDNCTDSIYKEVPVYASPEPVFHYNSLPCDSNLYFHDSTTFTGSGTISSWTWIWGDGTPNTVINAPGPGDATHLYINPGFYEVILQVTNARGCFDTTSMEVQRHPCIQAAFLHPDTLLCARYQVAFTDSSAPTDIITQWHWKWDDGTADTFYTVYDPLLHHTFTNGGTFNVRLIINTVVAGTTVADSSTQTLLIHPTPITLFSNGPVCLNQVTLFADTSTTFGARTTKWNWDFGESYSTPGDTSGFRNPTYMYDSAGFFNVRLRIMNEYGCEDSLTKSTRVFAIPKAKLSNTVACSGNPTYFYDKSVIGDTLIGYWFWRFGDVSSKKDSSLIQNPYHIYDTTGIYQVNFRIRDKNGCLSFKDTSVIVNVTPTSSFTFTDNMNGIPGKLLMNNMSGGASAYFWDFGNGQTSTDEDPIVTYSMDGSYVIKLIASNQFTCADTSYYKYDMLFKGLYVPNAFSPTNSNIAVRLFKPVGINLKEYHIEVLDNWGHVLWESDKLDAQGKPKDGWDGTYKNELMPQGVYAWKIHAIFTDDTPWFGSTIGKGDYKNIGTVTLLR